MSDEPSIKTKTDVLDLVISFIMDHENRMDQMVERLERLTNKLPSSNYKINNALTSRDYATTKPEVFSLVINNPKDFKEIKSVKIEWDIRNQELIHENARVNTILSEIKHHLRED